MREGRGRRVNRGNEGSLDGSEIRGMSFDCGRLARVKVRTTRAASRLETLRDAKEALVLAAQEHV